MVKSEIWTWEALHWYCQYIGHIYRIDLYSHSFHYGTSDQVFANYQGFWTFSCIYHILLGFLFYLTTIFIIRFVCWSQWIRRCFSKSYCRFWPTGPSGPSWSSSRKVCVLCVVCPLPMRFILRPLIGPQVTWSDPGLSLVPPPPHKIANIIICM